MLNNFNIFGNLTEQAGTELGQAQLQLELDFTCLLA